MIRVYVCIVLTVLSFVCRVQVVYDIGTDCVEYLESVKGKTYADGITGEVFMAIGKMNTIRRKFAEMDVGKHWAESSNYSQQMFDSIAFLFERDIRDCCIFFITGCYRDKFLPNRAIKYIYAIEMLVKLYTEVRADCKRHRIPIQKMPQATKLPAFYCL
jgi:hypothetical protein